MITNPSYRKAFLAAIGLHFFLIIALLAESSSQRPVLTPETKNILGTEQPLVNTPQKEIVKAVSVDNKQITDVINRLKQEREQQKNAEINRQNQLKRQAEAARQQRIKEQQQLARLKDESNKIAIARKKQAEEEKKRLKQLAEQTILETKRVDELKKQQEQLVKQQKLEVQKLAELNKKKLAQREQAERAKAEMEKKKQAEAAAAKQAQAAQHAERQARIAGEVDKYKALIVNAIGRNWILPENIDSSLSSQFRIRLAPDGMVLEVTLTRSSGDSLLDRSAQTAIYKASPLPVPTDSDTFSLFRDISLTVRPEQIRG